MDITGWQLGDPHPHRPAHGGPIGHNWLMFLLAIPIIFHELKQHNNNCMWLVELQKWPYLPVEQPQLRNGVRLLNASCSMVRPLSNWVTLQTHRQPRLWGFLFATTPRHQLVQIFSCTYGTRVGTTSCTYYTYRNWAIYICWVMSRRVYKPKPSELL
jgi:hypothetical protein